VDNIVSAFSKHDPVHADIYLRNGDAYKARITSAIAPIRAVIKTIPKERRWLVSCEGAFTYLANDLGLKELYLWPINADQQGTPQQVRKVIDSIRTHNIPAIFCESTVNNDPAKQIARETEATYGGILYVDSLSTADGPVPTYIDLLLVTTSTIVKGLVEAL
jgi:manganese/iron transport system substrate-binding protein